MAKVHHRKMPGSLCDQCLKLSPDDSVLSDPAIYAAEDAAAMKGELYPVFTLLTKYRIDDTLPGLPFLRSSEDSGCHGCGLLRRSILAASPTGDGPITFEVQYKWQKKEVNALALIGIAKGQNGNTWSVPFVVETDTDIIATWLRIFPSSSRQVWCEDNITKVRSFIGRCLTNCHPQEPAKFVPSRLVYIPPSSSHEPRLVLKGSIPTSEIRSYATLSYCWGPPSDFMRQLKTTAESLEEHLTAIPVAKMSPIMRDTVYVCRSLSIQYIWIDALCILQDDVRDWEIESAEMGEIYSHSFLTICTPSSTSRSQGILGTRDNSNIRLNFQSTVHPHIKGTLVLQPVEPEKPNPLPEREHPYLRVESSAWATRGWTLQEKYLAQRILYFHRRMISFECRDGLRAENGFSRDARSLKFIETVEQFARGHETKHRLYHRWRETIIREHFKRQFTVIQDRLPSLSGLAKTIHRLTNDVFCAGFWKEGMTYSLLWGLSPRENQRISLFELLSSFDANPFIAPSWSVYSRQSAWISWRIGQFGPGVDWHVTAEYDSLSLNLVMEGKKPLGRLRNNSDLKIRAKCLALGSAHRMKLDRMEGGPQPLCQIESQVLNSTIAECRLDFHPLSSTGHYDLERLSLLLVATSCGRTGSAGSKIGSNPEAGTSRLAGETCQACADCEGCVWKKGCQSEAWKDLA
ncbi:heterokaryon incompatibility protein-domain-containing protein [Xylaria cf. heliscus]|nr:heterokaryon incompatibility protein-domain-containing protein [Xylaria cf. heliscus]